MPFVKGKSGNPGGRPRTTLTDILRQVLDEAGPEGKSNGVLIMTKLTAMAVSGHIDAIKIVLDRVDGKVVDPEPANALAGKVLEFLVKERNAANP